MRVAVCPSRPATVISTGLFVWTLSSIAQRKDDHVDNGFCSTARILSCALKPASAAAVFVAGCAKIAIGPGVPIHAKIAYRNAAKIRLAIGPAAVIDRKSVV